MGRLFPRRALKTGIETDAGDAAKVNTHQLKTLLGISLLLIAALAFVGCSDPEDVETGNANSATNAGSTTAPSNTTNGSTTTSNSSTTGTPAGSKTGQANIQATPTSVKAGEGKGTAKISWSVPLEMTDVKVFVSQNGEPESEFAAGPEGSQDAAWIVAGSTYEFRLYSGSGGNRKMLGKVQVTGTK